MGAEPGLLSKIRQAFKRPRFSPNGKPPSPTFQAVREACAVCSGQPSEILEGELACPILFHKCGLRAHVRETLSGQRPEPTWAEAVSFAGSLPHSPPPAEEALPEGAVGIYRVNGLGDVLMTIPALRAARSQGHPTALFTQAAYAPLLRRCPFIDRVIVSDQAPPGAFDLDIEDSLIPDFHPDCLKRERIDLMMEACGLDPATVPDVEKRPVLELRAGEVLLADHLWQRWDWQGAFVVGVCLESEAVPRSMSWRGQKRIKEWLARAMPEAKTLAFGDGLRHADLWDRALDHAPLPLVAAALNHCQLLLSVDTSAVHLTAALDVPTVAFYSEIPASCRTTYYPRVMVLEGACGQYPCGGSGATCNRAQCLEVDPEALGDAVIRTGALIKYWEKPEYTDPREYGSSVTYTAFPEGNPGNPDHHFFLAAKWLLEQVRGDRILSLGTLPESLADTLLSVPFRRTLDTWGTGGTGNGEEGFAPPTVRDWDTVIFWRIPDPLEPDLLRAVTEWKPGRIVMVLSSDWQEVDLEDLIEPLGGTWVPIPDRAGIYQWWGVTIDRPPRRRRGTVEGGWEK